MLERELQQRIAAFEVEFVGDVGAMMFDGARADAEFIGDLFTRESVGDVFEYAAFGYSQ